MNSILECKQVDIFIEEFTLFLFTEVLELVLDQSKYYRP